MTFYERYVELCRSFRLSPSAAAERAGLNRSAVTRWKHMPDSLPTGRAIELLTAFFGITAGELLGSIGTGRPEGLPEPQVLLEVFGTTAGITPEMWQQVRDFAVFLADRQREGTPKASQKDK